MGCVPSVGVVMLYSKMGLQQILYFNSAFYLDYRAQMICVIFTSRDVYNQFIGDE